MRVLLRHRSRYRYPKPAALGAQVIRLRPAAHAKANIETYSLRTSAGEVRWQQDAIGNRIARITFNGEKVESFAAEVEIAVDIRPVNPFDFTVDGQAQVTPFRYTAAQEKELAPYLDLEDAQLEVGPKARAFLDGLPGSGTTVDLIVELNRLVNAAFKYVIREEAGIFTPEETLEEGKGSCRDLTVLLMRALRERGIAARFVSGYLIQLTDEGMIPDEPKGVSRDVVDLHAWVEAWLPGAGWVGLDATSGLLCGEGHIPLACAAVPSQASPIEGTTDTPADEVSFSMEIGRLGHEPRPTAPYTDAVWTELTEAVARTDAEFQRLSVPLTIGGEPTFNSRLYPDAPEWNNDALGSTKWTQGLLLAKELLRRLAPGGAMLYRQGKSYPGESLPRWALDLVGRKDGVPLWREVPEPHEALTRVELELQAAQLARTIASKLGLDGFVQATYEDPWRFLQEEVQLPLDVDPMRAKLKDAEERRRLARVLERGLGTEVGWALPLVRDGKVWRSEVWTLRRGRIHLIPGDSPMGLRLPLSSLGGVPWVVRPLEPGLSSLDPRTEEAIAIQKARDDAAFAQFEAKILRERYEGLEEDDTEPEKLDPARLAQAKARATQRAIAESALQLAERHADAAVARFEQLQANPTGWKPFTGLGIRTTLCVEARDGAVRVFLPPVVTNQDFFDLLAVVDASREGLQAPVMLEGYPPPVGRDLFRLQVTPDPGVLEVNLPPCASGGEHARLVDTVFDAALHSGLHAERYQVDGRTAGSQGGNHITLGGPSPLQSPFVRDPRLLASLVTFTQHHPSLSFLFNGLFVGPTSQSPRVDEARNDTLSELEIALGHAFATKPGQVQPWFSDSLFRNLLADVSGNTHRTEICIDKLFDWRTPHGRQGVVELRAFEMPPHPRMMVAQAAIVRALVASFAKEPYQAPLARFGEELHDRYLLPTWLWRDLKDVLAHLERAGLGLPEEAYRAFLELRCPLAGRMQLEDLVLEVRNALEPWNVLGEEPGTSGTSRFVDSSLERVEVKVMGLVPERHVVLVNGVALPLRSTGTAHEVAGGVRFRAWELPHSLHPHLGVHHPLRFDVVDTWGRRSMGACAYHVWHPEGRAYAKPPLTRVEAMARRSQRFTIEGPAAWPVQFSSPAPDPRAPWTLDLRRLQLDHPEPKQPLTRKERP